MSSVCLAKFNQNTGFSDFLLCDIHGQSLIGIYEMSVKCVICKLKKTISEIELFSLRCSIVNSPIKNQNGTVLGDHSPLEFFELKGQKDTIILRVFSNPDYFVFADKTIIKFWLTNLKERKVDVDLCVQFTYRKKNC